MHDNFCFLRADGWYADLTRCDYILCCVNSRGVTHKCPSGLQWQVTGPGKGICNFKKFVKCRNGVRNFTTTIGISKKMINSKSKTIFSTKTPSYLITKPVRISKLEINEKTSQLNMNKSLCTRHGLFPDPYSCTHYLACSRRKADPIRMRCPAGLHFKESKPGNSGGYCAFPYQVHCEK